MTDILVERQWPQPLTEHAMMAMFSAAESCLVIHRLAWCGSLLSADGLDLLCHFRGPDAESARIAMRQLGSPPGRVWTCCTHDAPGIVEADLATVQVVISHRFDAPTDVGMQMLEERSAGCSSVHRVRIVRRYLSLDGLRVDWLCQAPDAESVRLAQRHADLPPGRIWAVRRFAP